MPPKKKQQTPRGGPHPTTTSRRPHGGDDRYHNEMIEAMMSGIVDEDSSYGEQFMARQFMGDFMQDIMSAPNDDEMYDRLVRRDIANGHSPPVGWRPGQGAPHSGDTPPTSEDEAAYAPTSQSMGGDRFVGGSSQSQCRGPPRQSPTSPLATATYQSNVQPSRFADPRSLAGKMSTQGRASIHSQQQEALRIVAEQPPPSTRFMPPPPPRMDTTDILFGCGCADADTVVYHMMTKWYGKVLQVQDRFLPETDFCPVPSPDEYTFGAWCLKSGEWWTYHFANMQKKPMLQRRQFQDAPRHLTTPLLRGKTRVFYRKDGSGLF